ncbi:MAG: glycosyltransferase family 4 protein [Gammaproteobacteria bacterium]|nr:glycosyltransferase family 4 protein [Gammaproteobacteria bacterium]
MKILHVSNAAQLGGAGIAAHRLHRGLMRLNSASMMLVNKRRHKESSIVGAVGTFNKIMSKLTPLLDRVPGHFSSIDMDRVSASWVPDRLVNRIKKISPDVLNLHWVNDGFMSIETLAKFDQPVVWTLHDMWAFSGGEHYVGNSVRYKEGYSKKNRPLDEKKLDIHRWIWARKKKSWSTLGEKIVIAAPSKWMARCASESALFNNFRVEVLPNGIDHERYHPVDHTIARKILGLPEDKKLILFGAGSATSDKRKGYHLLVDAISKLEAWGTATDYELIVFGASSGESKFSMKTHYLGILADEISLALVYAAADVFVAPSLEDNLPNTVLESLACGTPVVAFNTGGMPDMILHKTNGYLASAFDVDDLARGLFWVLENNKRWDGLSAEARDTVLQSFTLEQSAKRYLSLYQELLERF